MFFLVQMIESRAAVGVQAAVARSTGTAVCGVSGVSVLRGTAGLSASAAGTAGMSLKVLATGPEVCRSGLFED